MNYEVYRNTTLGNTLQEVLDDLLQVRLIKYNILNKANYKNKNFGLIRFSI